MRELALNTPTKNVEKVGRFEFNLFDDAPREESPDTVDSCVIKTAEAEVDFGDAELEELRKQFVGDLDITEGSYHNLSPTRRVFDVTFI